MTEKPLRVRVAEVLGCKPVMTRRGWNPDGGPEHWLCTCELGDHEMANAHYPLLACYDTDWSATGPLVEKYVHSISGGGPPPRSLGGSQQGT